MAIKKNDQGTELGVVNGLYGVPSNWKWVTLDSIGTIVTGSTPSKKKDEYYGGNFPFVKPTDLDQGRNIISASEYLTEEGKKVSRVLPPESISVCCIGSIGKSGYLSFEATTNQQINTIVPNINSLYVYYYCNTNSFINSLQLLASSTTIALVNKTKMSTLPFPLPPLPEQQRIVNKIEALFEKIDKAETLINQAREGFEKRQEAILAKAFRGELTETWREENNYNIEQWEETTLGEKIRLLSGQDVARKFCNDLGEGIPYILGASNLSARGFIVERWIVNPKVVSKKNDVLLSVKGTIGKVYLQIEEEINISRQIMAIRNNGEWNNKFLYYFMVNEANRLSNEGNGLIPGIPRSKVLDTELRLPPITEQNKIVSVLDKLIESEKISYELSYQNKLIGDIKKSILAKAFRGELGTNNPEDIHMSI